MVGERRDSSQELSACRDRSGVRSSWTVQHRTAQDRSVVTHLAGGEPRLELLLLPRYPVLYRAAGIIQETVVGVADRDDGRPLADTVSPPEVGPTRALRLQYKQSTMFLEYSLHYCLIINHHPTY